MSWQYDNTLWQKWYKAHPDTPAPQEAKIEVDVHEVNVIATDVINKKLEEAGRISNIDWDLHGIKKEVESVQQNTIDVKKLEEKTVWQTVKDFFTNHGSQTLDQLPDDDETEVWLLAIDLAVYKCIVSVIRHRAESVLKSHPTITQVGLTQIINKVLWEIAIMSDLASVIKNKSIQVDFDENAVIEALSNKSVLASDYMSSHGNIASHYDQVMDVIKKQMPTVIADHFRPWNEKAVDSVKDAGNKVVDAAGDLIQSGKEKATWLINQYPKTSLLVGTTAVVWLWYRIYKWWKSDKVDESTLTPEQKANKWKYESFMESGKRFLKQDNQWQALIQFNEALKTWYHNKEAEKRINKCSWGTRRSNIWSWLKRAAGIWLAGGVAYWLYKWRNNDGIDKKPDMHKAIDDVNMQIKKFEELTPEEQALYNGIWDSINNTYSQINRFPWEPDGSPANNENPLWSYGELKLGTGTDKYPGVIPYIYSWYDNIWQIIKSDQIFNMIIHADINQIEEVIKNLIAGGAEYIVAGIAQATGFDRVAWQGERFINWIKEGNNSQIIKTVCRKLIKGMSWLHLVQRHQTGSQIMDLIKKGSVSIDKGTDKVTIPQDDAELYKLINKMLSDPTSYSLDGKSVQEYIDEFQSKSIKDLGTDQVKSISHDQLMIYNQEIQDSVDNINQDRNQIHTKLKTEWPETTIDYLIQNIGKDISNGVVDSIGNYINNNAYNLSQYLPFAGALSGLYWFFDSNKENIVTELMSDTAGFKEMIDTQTKKLQALRGKSPQEIQQGIDEYFATLKELSTGKGVLMNINKSEKDWSYTLSLTNGVMGMYNTTKNQILGGLEMIFDPDASSRTKVKWFFKTYAGVWLPAMLRWPTRSLYLKSLKPGINVAKRGGNKVLEVAKTQLSKIRNPRVPASVTNQQVKAVWWINNILNTHPRLLGVAKNAKQFASLDAWITNLLWSNAWLSDDFLKLWNALAQDTKLAWQLKLCKDAQAVESLLQANNLWKAEMKAIFELWSHTWDDLIKFVDHVWHFPLKNQIRTWMKIPGMAVLNWPIAQTMLKVVWVAGWVLEAITTWQSYRASKEEIKAMEADNQELAEIMESEQWATLMAWGASAGLAIASAIVWWPVWLVLLAWYIGMQGVKVWVDTYYDVMKFYNLNTVNYLKQNTWFIKSAIISAKSWNEGINMWFKDLFQSFVSRFPLWTEDFYGLTKMNKADWTAREAMIALLILDEITRKPDINSDALHKNIGIRISYIENKYPTWLIQNDLKDGTKAFDKIDQMIKESHQHQIAKSSDFNCDTNVLENKYKVILSEHCEGGVENLDAIYSRAPTELHKMYALCQSPYFDTLLVSKQDPTIQQKLKTNKTYLINYRNYKTLDTSMEDLPSTMLWATEDLTQFENFLLYDFTDISKQVYNKEEAISMLQHNQYQWYDLQTNATLYWASGKPGQDFLYHYAKYLWYGISSDPKSTQWANTLEGLKQFFAYEEWKDEGMSNQDKKGIYRNEEKQQWYIKKHWSIWNDKMLITIDILNTIKKKLWSGDKYWLFDVRIKDFIDLPTWTAETTIAQAYGDEMLMIINQITQNYQNQAQIVSNITKYIKSRVKPDWSQFVELPSDMIKSAMESGCGNVQPYLYGCKDDKLYGMVSEKHFEHYDDKWNLTNKLIDNENYEKVSSAQTTSTASVSQADKVLWQ